MEKGIKENLQLLLLPLFVGLPIFWAIAQFELSKEIGDESVQSYYAMLAEPSNPLKIPSSVHSSLVAMMKDGFSSNDYYDLNEVIRVECGASPMPFFDKQVTRTMLGIMQFFSFKAISVDSSIALSNGQIIANQLDAMLCESD